MTELIDAFPVPDDALARLRARLADTAGDLLDVAYRTVDSPVGRLLLAATPAGLVKVGFVDDGEEVVLQQLSDRISPRVLAAPSRLDAVATQLDEYFGGRRRVFDVPLDWQLSAGFRLQVLHHLATDVAYGTTTSYAGLAGLAGNPKAVRAVGTTCATNPLLLVVPCHRVVRSDGSMGRYAGGEEAKRTLLQLESAG